MPGSLAEGPAQLPVAPLVVTVEQEAPLAGSDEKRDVRILELAAELGELVHDAGGGPRHDAPPHESLRLELLQPRRPPAFWSGAPGDHPSMAPGLDPSGAPSAARTLLLAAEPTAPARARAELLSFLDGATLTAGRLFDLQLLVSELVSNAVLHGSGAGDEVEVTYERRGNVL